MIYKKQNIKPIYDQNEVSLSRKLDELRDAVFVLLEEINALKLSENCDLRRGGDLHEEVRRYEISLIVSALEQTGGSQTRAAQLLGVKQTTLNEKIKRYRISPRTLRSAAHFPSAVER